MTKIIPTPKTVCRTPAFSLQITLEEAWPALKCLIADASPEFYQKIADLHAKDIPHQPEKIQFTIWKYFNRSKYRATPFGRFAAVSLVPVKPIPSKGIIIKQEMLTHKWPDWTASQVSKEIKTKPSDVLYRTNPSSYIHQEEYRYLVKEKGQFVLNAIPKWDEITTIMEFCKIARRFDTIADHLKSTLEVTEKQSERLIKQLVELQAIQCNHQPNITGIDYFKRISALRETEASASYTIASRELDQGHLYQTQLYQVAEYLRFAARCQPVRQYPELELFRRQFVERWENQAIPLSQALDPILGIPYGNDIYPAETALLGELKKHRSPKEDSSIRYTEFEQFLLNKMLTGKKVLLEEFDKTSLEIPNPLPNTCSVQLHFYENKPVIHTAGGASATSLLGRFTHIPEFYSYGKTLTDIEQQANPEVIFFNLAYECEGRVDNVNRRQHLYPTELAFSSWSTMETPLRIEDILVSIVHDQIILHHQQTGKRLIPRLASAYNYGRSDLAHFRFLCDLQHQQVQPSLQIDLQQIFPKLEKYPRLCYKECIVNPARWLLPSFSSLTQLREWLAKQKIHTPFSIGNGDQTLLIDPHSEEDLYFLLLHHKKHPQNYITEALLPERATVQDEDKAQYHAEFIVDFYHMESVYHTYPVKRESLLNRDIRLPGDEWLYLELYINPVIADDFLTTEIKGLIAHLRHNLKQWFFIRYNYPEEHIRLRLKPQKPKYLSDILQHIHRAMDIPRRSGRLKKIVIMEYDREIHRYGVDQMELVEQFFYQDSKIALADIEKPAHSRYGISMGFIQTLCERLYPDIEDQIHYFSTLSNSFAKEMAFDKNDFKLINKEFASYHIIQKSTLRRLPIFDRVMESCPPNKRRQLLADLIHMHINRRFSNDQRLHEAIIYQYLHKSSLAIYAQRALVYCT